MTMEGAASFAKTSSDDYDRFMGRYATRLAPLFADFAGIQAPMTVLDVGCGPGALTGELVARLGADSVSACDPAPPFIAAFTERFPGVTVKAGRMESLPFESDRFDAALAQLVLHFVERPDEGVAEMMRVTRSGGHIGASVWDLTGGMEMFRVFADAVNAITGPDSSYTHPTRFGSEGEIRVLFEAANLTSIEERLLAVDSTYADFEEFWTTIRTSAGPLGEKVRQMADTDLTRLRDALFERLDQPAGSITLNAQARAVVATVP